MSRVTIETIDNIIHYEDAEEVRKLWDIEIVPRKIVEMIIAKCELDREKLDLTYTFDRGRNCEAEDIKQYAESLLEKFENDGQI